MASSHHTNTRVQLTGVHLCCRGCVDAVVTAAESVPGVTARCDMAHGTATLNAQDVAAAQQALDAIAAAGLHGETGDAHLAMRPQRDLPPGRVQRLTVSGIHNCCQPCYEAIRGAIYNVDGVTSDTAEPGKSTFEVTGHFSATELVHALNTAGFHAKVTIGSVARDCRYCGRSTTLQFGDTPVCEECYQKAGSCCLEFGDEDLWKNREEEPRGSHHNASGSK